MKQTIILTIMAVLMLFSASAKDLVASSVSDAFPMEIRFNANKIKTEFSGNVVYNGNMIEGASVTMMCQVNWPLPGYPKPVNQYTAVTNAEGNFFMQLDAVEGEKCDYGNEVYFTVELNDETYVSETFMLSRDTKSSGVSSLAGEQVSVPEFGTMTAAFAIAGAGLVLALLRKR